MVGGPVLLAQLRRLLVPALVVLLVLELRLRLPALLPVRRRAAVAAAAAADADAGAAAAAATSVVSTVAPPPSAAATSATALDVAAFKTASAASDPAVARRGLWRRTWLGGLTSVSHPGAHAAWPG